MEPKVINEIAHNLDIIKKICEQEADTTKKTFSEIINGEDVKGIIDSITEKMEKISEGIEAISLSELEQNEIAKENNSLLQSDPTSLELLALVVSINNNVEKILNAGSARPGSKENQQLLKNILDDVSKDKGAQVLLAAAMMGQDIPKNLSKVGKYAKGAEKGIETLRTLLIDKLVPILNDLIDDLGGETEDVSNILEFVKGCGKGFMNLALSMSAMLILGVPAIGGAMLTSVMITILSGSFKHLKDSEKSISEGGKVLNGMGIAMLCIAGALLILVLISKLDTSGMKGTMMLFLELAGIFILLSQLTKPVEHGVETALGMGIALLSISLSIVILTQLTGNIEWGSLGKTMIMLVVFAGVFILINMFSKPIEDAMKTMVGMGIALLSIVVSMGLAYLICMNMEWEEIGKTLLMVVTFAGIAILLNVFSKPVGKGMTVMLGMGLGYLLLSISMVIMYETVKRNDWDMFGKMILQVAAMAAVVALMGIPVVAGFITAGSIALGVMGLGFIAVSVGVWLFGKLVTEDAIDRIAEGVPKILEAMMSVFGTNKESPSFGDSIMGIVIGALKLGGAIFAAGALIIIGISLAIFALSMMVWKNFDRKSIDNVEYAWGKIKEMFDLDSKQSGSNVSISDGIFDMVIAFLKFGKVLFQMGTVLIIGVTMLVLYGCLMKWKSFDIGCIDIFEEAYLRIKEIFQIDDDSKKGVSGLSDGIFELLCAALQFGATFFRMGTILLVTYTMGLIYDKLQIWKDFDMGCIDIFEEAYNRIKEIFQIENDSAPSMGDLIDGIFEIICAALQFGATFFRMGTILLCVYTMGLIYDNVQVWSEFDMGCIDTFEEVYIRLKNIFQIDTEGPQGPSIGEKIFEFAKAVLSFGTTLFRMGMIILCVYTMKLIADAMTEMKGLDMKVMDTFEQIYNKIRKIFEIDKSGSSLGGIGKEIFDFLKAVIGFGKTLFQMGQILMCVYTMKLVAETMEDMKNFDMKAMNTFEQVYKKIRKIFKLDGDEEGEDGGFFGSLFGMASAALQMGKTFFEMGTILTAVSTMQEVYKGIQCWAQYNSSSMKNFESVYDQLRRMFIFNSKRKGSGWGIFDQIDQLASAALRQGEMFYEMGTLLMAVITMRQIYTNIAVWAKFNFMSLANFSVAYKWLRKIFKFDEEKKEGVSFSSKEDEMGSAMMAYGKAFYEMGIMLVTVNVMNIVHDKIAVWETFSPKAIENFATAYYRLREIFKFDEEKKEGITSLCMGGKSGDLANSMLEYGKQFFQMGILLMTTHVMNSVYYYIRPWENFDFKALMNFGVAYKILRKIFKFDEDSENGVSFKSLESYKGNGELGRAMLEHGKQFFQMGILLMTTEVMYKVYYYMKPWEKMNKASYKNMEYALNFLRENIVEPNGLYWDYQYFEKSMGYLDKAMTVYVSISKKMYNSRKYVYTLRRLIKVVNNTLSELDLDELRDKMNSIRWMFSDIFDRISDPGYGYEDNANLTIKLFKSLKALEKMNYKKTTRPLRTIVNAVNRLDIEKATALKEMFDSFIKVGENDIFSSFKDTVEEFTNACIRLVEAINGNTEALNGEDEEDGDTDSTSSYSQMDPHVSESNTNTKKSSNVRISNIEELAQAIASRIGGMGGKTNGHTTVDLRINGSGGNSWTIRKNF